ncbi:MAG: ferredoxin III, nif-specific [Pseudomonadota bacterium]
MADLITGVTRGGAAWTPAFITDLDQTTCIGCGRCFKVCPRDVFDLVEREDDESDGDGFSDDTSMVMAIKDALDCIGCQSCSKVCPKNCHSHAPFAA